MRSFRPISALLLTAAVTLVSHTVLAGISKRTGVRDAHDRYANVNISHKRPPARLRKELRDALAQFRRDVQRHAASGINPMDLNAMGIILINGRKGRKPGARGVTVPPGPALRKHRRVKGARRWIPGNPRKGKRGRTPRIKGVTVPPGPATREAILPNLNTRGIIVIGGKPGPSSRGGRKSRRRHRSLRSMLTSLPRLQRAVRQFERSAGPGSPQVRSCKAKAGRCMWHCRSVLSRARVSGECSCTGVRASCLVRIHYRGHPPEPVGKWHPPEPVGRHPPEPVGRSHPPEPVRPR